MLKFILASYTICILITVLLETVAQGVIDCAYDYIIISFMHFIAALAVRCYDEQ